jgi:sulfite exporter TauE/SafE
MTGLQAQIGAAFAIALFGGMHCAGMCGGFVGALQMHRPARIGPFAFSLSYHLGRVAGYGSAGLLAGCVGSTLFAADVLPLQIALLVLGSVFLAGIGGSLLGSAAWLRRLEPLGGALWRAVRPLASRVLPPRTMPAALLAGFVWGWIPCGMVYAALPLALVAGSAVAGAAVMLAFGIGTLPNLLALDLGAARLRALVTGGPARVWLRTGAGIAILLFAASDLAHAARLAGADATTLTLLASLCHSGVH